MLIIVIRHAERDAHYGSPPPTLTSRLFLGKPARRVLEVTR
jgi:hypothetical protein